MAVAAGACALVITWSVVTPWDVPVWPLLAFVPVPALAWWLAADAAPGVRVGALVAVVVVVVGTVALWASPWLGQLRFGNALDAMEQAAVVVLADAPPTSEACGSPPPLDYGVLGVPAEVCVVTYALGLTMASSPASSPAADTGGSSVVPAAGDAGDGTLTDVDVRQVRFDWPGDVSALPDRSLVFEAGVAQPPAGRCVRQVDGRWWAWVLPSGGCARGFVPSSG